MKDKRQEALTDLITLKAQVELVGKLLSEGHYGRNGRQIGAAFNRLLTWLENPIAVLSEPSQKQACQCHKRESIYMRKP